MNKSLSPSNSIALFAMLIGGSLVLQLLLSWLMVPEGAVSFWVFNGMYSLSLMGIAYVYCRLGRFDFAKNIGIKALPNIGHLSVLLVIVFALVNGMVPINDLFVEWLEGMGANVGGISSDMVYGNIVLAVIVTCVIVPIVEEVVFRGVIGSGLLHGGRVVVAIVLGGAMFALFHMNLSQLLHQLVSGCVFMLFFCKSGSLWVVIIGHVFNNALVLALDRWVYGTGVYDTYGVLIACVGIGVALMATSIYIWLAGNKRAVSSNAVASLMAQDYVLLSIALAVLVLILVMNV